MTGESEDKVNCLTIVSCMGFNDINMGREVLSQVWSDLLTRGQALSQNCEHMDLGDCVIGVVFSGLFRPHCWSRSGVHMLRSLSAQGRVGNVG